MVLPDGRVAFSYGGAVSGETGEVHDALVGSVLLEIYQEDEEEIVLLRDV